MFVTFSWGIMFTSHFFSTWPTPPAYIVMGAPKEPLRERTNSQGKWTDANTVFDTRNMCWDSGLWLEQGAIRDYGYQA